MRLFFVLPLGLCVSFCSAGLLKQAICMHEYVYEATSDDSMSPKSIRNMQRYVSHMVRRCQTKKPSDNDVRVYLNELREADYTINEQISSLYIQALQTDDLQAQVQLAELMGTDGAHMHRYCETMHAIIRPYVCMLHRTLSAYGNALYAAAHKQLSQRSVHEQNLLSKRMAGCPLRAMFEACLPLNQDQTSVDGSFFPVVPSGDDGKG